MAESFGDVTGSLKLDTSAFSKSLHDAQAAMQGSTARMAGQLGALGQATEKASGFFGRFGVATSQSVAGLGKASAAVGVFQSNLAGLAATLAPLAAAGGLIKLVQQAADLGDELNRLSIQTGVGVEALNALKIAADLNDASVQDLSIAFRQMAVNVAEAARGTGAAAPVIKALGFTIDEMRRAASDPQGFLEEFAKRLFRIEDAGTRSEVAFRVLGRGAQTLMPLLQDLSERGLKGINEEANRLGLTIGPEFARASDDFNDNITRLGTALNGLKVTYLFPVIKAFNDLAVAMGLVKQTPLQIATAPLEDSLVQLKKSRTELEAALPKVDQTGVTGFVWKQLFGVRDAEAAKQRLTEVTQQIAGLEQSLDALSKARPEPEGPPIKIDLEQPARAENAAATAAARSAAAAKIVEARLALEAAGLQKEQALRAVALEDEYQAALKNTVKTKADQERVERTFTQRRLEAEKQATLEGIDFEIAASHKVEAARITAIQAGMTATQKRDTTSVDAAKEVAGKLAGLEGEITTVKAEAEAQRTALAAKRAEAEKKFAEGTTAALKDELTKQRAAAVQVEELANSANQRRLQARIEVSNAQIDLITAETEGEVLSGQNSVEAKQRAYEQIRGIQAQRLEDSRALYEDEARAATARIEQEVEDETLKAAKIADINETLSERLQALEVRGAIERRNLLNQQLQAYKEFSDRVTEGLRDVWRDALDNGLDVIATLRNVALDTIAEVLAELTRPIVVPILVELIGAVGGVIPGLAGGLGGAAALASGAAGEEDEGGTGGGQGGLLSKGLSVVGFGSQANQLSNLFGLRSPLSSSITFFRNGLDAGAQGVANFANSLRFGSSQITETSIDVASAWADTAPMVAAEAPGFGQAGAATGGSILGAAGGLAAVGGGIYGALNARNNVSRGAYAASAAAGAFTAAAGSGLLAAATGVAATTGWTGYGLIAAAVLAVIGMITDSIISPAGPSLAVGRVGGLDIGTDSGQLNVQGDIEAATIRREGVTPDIIQGVHTQLGEGIERSVRSIVEVINRVALDPAALLGPTREALSRTLAAIRPINSGNAKKMQQDIAEQLRFVNAQVVAGLLEPLSQGFDQLRTGTLAEQVSRLPGTVLGLVDLFKGMNQELSEIAGSQNTDVLRQLSGVRGQVEQFGRRIAETAGQVAESIVTNITQLGHEAIQALIAQGDDMPALNFSVFMDRFSAAVGLRLTAETLKATGLDFTPIQRQLTRLFEGVIDDATLILGAFEGLRDTGTLEEHIIKLPSTVAGLVDIFNGMNQQLAEIDKLQSTEAVSELRRRVEGFGRGIAVTAGEIAEKIVTGVAEIGRKATEALITQTPELQALNVPGVFTGRLQAAGALQSSIETLGAAGLDFGPIQQQLERLFTSVIVDAFSIIEHALAEGPFDESLRVILAIPDAVVALNPLLAAYKAIAQVFAPLVGQLSEDIGTLRDGITPLTQRLAESGTRLKELGTAIQETGGDVAVALPLYDRLRQEILNNAQLQIQALQEIADAWHGLMDQVAQDIAGLEAIVVPVGERLSAAMSQSAEAFKAFSDAIASGKTLEAIKALQEYERLVIETANLRIEQIRAERQAVLDVQQAVIDGIQAEMDAWQDAIDVQQEVIDAWQDGARAWQEYIDGLEDTADAWRGYMDDLKDVADAWQDFIDDLKDAADAWREYIDALKETERAQQTLVDDLTRLVDALKQIRQETGDTIRGQGSPNAQAAGIRQQMAEAQAVLDDTSKTPEERTAALNRLVDLNKQLIRLGEESNNLSLIQEGLNNLANIQVFVDASLAYFGEQLSLAEQQLEATKTQISLAQQHLDATNAQISLAQQHLDAINVQIDLAQQQLEATRAQIDLAQQHLDAINVQIDIEQKQLDALNQQLKDAGERLKIAQAQLAELEKSTYWDEQIAAVQSDALAELRGIRAGLLSIQGDTTWEDQMLNVQRDAKARLEEILGALHQLYVAAVGGTGAQEAATDYARRTKDLLEMLTSYNLALPLQVSVKNFYEAPRQHGGFVGLQHGGPIFASMNHTLTGPLHLAHGGLVPLMTEPGEMLFTPPVPPWVPALNQAIPRFAGGGFLIPGSGSGDHVPILAPAESFVLNRTAVHAAGFQEGGAVSTMDEPGGDTYIQNINGPTFRQELSLEDLKRLWRTLERQSLTRSHG